MPEELVRALEESGLPTREGLEQAVHGRPWGPGRFAGALREDVGEFRARHLPDDRHAPPDRPGKPGGASGAHRNRSA
ncbi:hypothetical protein ACWGQ5_54995 [Streptomyces sp. NPDC055722]